MVTTTRESSICLLNAGGAPAQGDPQPAHPGPAVLIVEDDIPTLRLERIILEEEGYQVSVVRSGEEALASLSSQHPSLILLDIGLPGLDGFATCEGIRKLSQVPIIMVTGRDCLDDKVRGMEAGSDDYVTKPFLIHELSTRVKVLLRRSNISLEPESSGLASLRASSGRSPSQDSQSPSDTQSSAPENANELPTDSTTNQEPVTAPALESSANPAEDSTAASQADSSNPATDTPPENPPSAQVSWTFNHDWQTLESTIPEDAANGDEEDGEASLYEGTVRLMVDSRGSIRHLMNFVGELRQNPQYRLLRLVANQHKEGMDVWLGLREPVPLLAQILEMTGVAAVKIITDFDPAENEHLLNVQLIGE